jgi:hypothetical protein
LTSAHALVPCARRPAGNRLSVPAADQAAAVHRQTCPVTKAHPSRRRRRFRDVFRRAHALQRRARDDAPLQSIHIVLGPQHRAGRNGVDADFRAEFARERLRQHHERRLGGAIDRVPAERTQPMDVGDVEDQPPAPAQFRRGGLRQEQRRAQVGADEVLECVPRDLADRRRIEGGGIVDEHVERAEGADDGGGQRLERGEIGEIGAEGRGRRRTLGIHRAHQRAGLGGGAVVMHGQLRAPGVKGLRDDRADAPRAAGDQHDLVSERRLADGGHGFRIAGVAGWRPRVR